MKNEADLQALLQVYDEKNHISSNDQLPPLNVSEIMATFFCPGPYYFFIPNFFDLRFEYVDPKIESMLGIQPGTFNVEKLIELMHPEDAEQMQFKELAAVEFFFKRIPLEQLPFYKASYTFRLKDQHGQWKSILHQSLTINITGGRIHRTLVVHTDISHLNMLPNTRISFIGIKGRPSFFSLSTDPNTLLQPEDLWNVSSRELEIIKFLSEGYSSKQIAEYLSISAHTVDTHRRNLLQKTGTKNTMELAVACIKKGLL